VKIIENIKQKIAILNLDKELKGLRRTVAFNNFESATTVGFIFDASNREKYQASRDFMEFVEKLNTRVFGIGFATNSDQIAYFPYKQGVDYFGLNEINWYGSPVSPVIKDFLKRNFDILVDLSQCEIFPVYYIFSLSNAKFKISNKSNKSKFADFVIENSNSDKIEDYIAQINHYLKAIKGKQS
jgi:hypothetical protein